MRRRLSRLLATDHDHRIVPLGDHAVLVYCLTEADAIAFAASMRENSPQWLQDVVHAYFSVAVFFDRNLIDMAGVSGWVKDVGGSRAPSSPATPACRHLIPCCYEYQLDMDRIAQQTQRSTDGIISYHLAVEYTVYAIGFCPGFPYLGYLSPEISGVSRLESPRTLIEAGSVGLTGRQTGIYTEPHPGGWNIIGRTPLELANVDDSYFPLRTGDRVQFQRIDEREFHRLSGERLAVADVT